jgi:hypothetical protein
LLVALSTAPHVSPAAVGATNKQKRNNPTTFTVSFGGLRVFAYYLPVLCRLLPPPRVAILLLLVSVAAPYACSMPIQQFELENQTLTCEDANQVTYKTLRAMGFTLTAFEPAKPGRAGVLKGHRERPGTQPYEQHVTVDIECTPTGTSVDAHEDFKLLDQLEFKRGFYHSFTSIVSMTAAEQAMQERIDAGTAPASQQRRDLQVLIEPVRGHEAKLDFEIDLAAAGVLPLRLSVNNRTKNHYRFEAGEIRLTRKDRGRVSSLTPEQAAARVVGARHPETGDPVTTLSLEEVSKRLGNELFVANAVAPGERPSGYLYFPLAEYRRARVVVVEVTSGESEGFMVEF